MTRRDGGKSVKIPRMDREDQTAKKYSFSSDNGDETTSFSQPASLSSKHRDGSGPRSASLPGSRASSRPGSRMASRTNSQESIIDLFEGMTLAYGRNGPEGKGFQLISPKPRLLPHQRWTWTEKLRINSAIWRSWHIQFVKGKKPIGCHFDPRLPESRPTLQADAIQSGRCTVGSIQYNQSQVGSVVRDYRRWRLYHMDAGRPGTGQSPENPEDKAIDLDTPHPPLSPMAARTLLNDDTLKDFSDTLFISKKKHFSVPHPKKIARHVYNADVFQPGLMQLEPDFDDDFMETLDSLQDMLCKTPTKVDLRSLIEFPEGLFNSDSMSGFSDSLLGPLTTVSEEMPDTRPQPTSMLSAATPYPTAIIANPANAARNLSFPSSSGATAAALPPLPSLQFMGHVAYTMQSNQSQASSSFYQQAPSIAMTTSPAFGQMPPIFEVSCSGPVPGPGPVPMGIQAGASSKQQTFSGPSLHSNVFGRTMTKQEPCSPPVANSLQSLHPGVDINDAIDILAAQLQLQQQQQQQQPQRKQWEQPQHQPSNQQNWNIPVYSQSTTPVSGNSQSNWSNSNLASQAQSASQSFPIPMESTVSWPVSNLPESLPSTGLNWSIAGRTSDADSVVVGGFPQGIMSQGGLSSSNMAFIQNAGGLPQIADAMAPMDKNIILGAAYSLPTNPAPSSGHVTLGQYATSSRVTVGRVSSGYTTPGHVTPGHATPGHVTPGHATQGHATPGHITPGHITPGHITPGHVTPGHVTPGHVTPGHVTPGHITPGHITPGHITPGHITPGYVTPGHVTPGHVTPGHVTPGHVTPGQSTPHMDEAMEFEEFPLPSTSRPAPSTTSAYKMTKRERPHSRRNSSELSPRVSQTTLPDLASFAGFIGKSEAKDHGMPSPSEASVIPFLPSSGHPSNVSSAASSPGSLTEGTEFEFPTPQAKRRKTPDSGEKESRRRYKHLQSEHKRRFNIQSGLDEIHRVVPGLRNTSDSNKSSTATMLQKAHEHIVNLKEDLKVLRSKTEELREEVQALNTEIDLCQEELPDSGAPVNAQSDRQLQQMMDGYVRQKMEQNWTFWIFSLIIRPLFESYMLAVSSSHVSDFDQTVQDWVEEHCRLKPLRKLVTSALTKVSRETSILMDPLALPTQIEELITKESDSQPHGKT